MQVAQGRIINIKVHCCINYLCSFIKFNPTNVDQDMHLVTLEKHRRFLELLFHPSPADLIQTSLRRHSVSLQMMGRGSFSVLRCEKEGTEKWGSGRTETHLESRTGGNERNKCCAEVQLWDNDDEAIMS